MFYYSMKICFHIVKNHVEVFIVISFYYLE